MSSGKGKTNTSSGDKAEAVSKSTRAGLTFPVARIGRYLKKGRFASRIAVGECVAELKERAVGRKS